MLRVPLILSFRSVKAGRDQRKKDLGAMAMAYQHVYASCPIHMLEFGSGVLGFAFCTLRWHWASYPQVLDSQRLLQWQLAPTTSNA